jgi:hypothetical protein
VQQLACVRTQNILWVLSLLPITKRLPKKGIVPGFLNSWPVIKI